jgi:hypothetical protein
MEAMTLAASAAALLAAFLGSVGSRAGTAAVGALERLYWGVKAAVAGQGQAETALDQLAARPDDPGRLISLQTALEQLIKDDPSLKSSLEPLVDDASTAGAVRISDAGVVALHGNVTIKGDQVAARDFIEHAPREPNEHERRRL